MVMAEKDAVLPPRAADGMEAFVPDLEKRLITDSGHWTQQEQPEAVNPSCWTGWTAASRAREPVWIATRRRPARTRRHVPRRPARPLCRDEPFASGWLDVGDGHEVY